MLMEYKQFYNYRVYENGDVYNKHGRKLKGELQEKKYIRYVLSINGKSVNYKAHRLVAMLYLENPNNLPVVNHIDGTQIPLNNHYTNLEWCDVAHNNKHARDNNLNNISISNSKRWENEEFRKRTAKRISDGIKKSGCSSGKNNPRFRYNITINDAEIQRVDLPKLLGISQSYADACIKKAANGVSIKKFIENNIKVEKLK